MISLFWRRSAKRLLTSSETYVLYHQLRISVFNSISKRFPVSQYSVRDDTIPYSFSRTFFILTMAFTLYHSLGNICTNFSSRLTTHLHLSSRTACGAMLPKGSELLRITIAT